jgi:hypothetical protein
MTWFDDNNSGSGNAVVYPQNDDFKPARAPFVLLWAFLASNFVLVSLSYIFRPQSLDSAIWLGLYWLGSFGLMIVGYYIFSVQAHKKKLSPDYSTPPSSEKTNRLTYLVISFLLTAFAAYPLAYELSRLVRL